ncbi:hypothetical protein GOODEAATRI_019822, partial [Goodea atripinnis]
EDYQECVSKKIETLRLFGEAPHKVTTQVTRTFVAARAFLQGLNTSREVVGKVLQVNLNTQTCRFYVSSPVFPILEDYFYCFKKIMLRYTLQCYVLQHFY